MKSLTTKFCLAISKVIENHPEKITANDVVNTLLSVTAAYSKHSIGAEKTLMQLAIQMAMVADHDIDTMQTALNRIKNSVAMQQIDPKAALLYSVLRKIGNQ